ncbi:CLUMA_CG001996, isoform A [Clunio marinus]|uniref:CLUMA_CG001996, isoform A n=1 Tax=Clunio marinus TaxID=568069 RepID=A0A1J1HJK2_9DIPT|nr:CLUMA_CG001996, isoform A [Clunio marinus]
MEKINILNHCLACFLVIQISSTLAQNPVRETNYNRREHSLIKPFLTAGLTVPYWDYTGSVMFTQSYVRLTPDEQSMSGAIWNQIPCWSRNWEIILSFKVAGKGKDLFGDGFAFWYAKDRMIVGPVFGSKDLFSGLAIIVDTYSNHNGPHNHQHPFISAMVNNGTLSYDHDRDGTHTQIAGCEARFRNVEYETLLKIRYDNDVLSVFTDLENKNNWKECFTVDGVELPTGYFFGASATTGDLSDNHLINSIKFYELDGVTTFERADIIPRATKFEEPREHVDDPKPGWSNLKIFCMLMFGMIGAVILSIAGYMYYEKYQQNKKKRFY